MQKLLEKWNIHLENHWFYPKNRWVFLKRMKPGSSGYYILILFSKPRTGSSLIAKCSCKREEEAAASRCLQNQSFQNPELAVLWYRKMFLRTNQISKIKTRISKLKFDSDLSSKPRTGSSQFRKWSSKEKPVSISKIKLDSKFSLNDRRISDWEVIVQNCEKEDTIKNQTPDQNFSKVSCLGWWMDGWQFSDSEMVFKKETDGY